MAASGGTNRPARARPEGDACRRAVIVCSAVSLLRSAAAEWPASGIVGMRPRGGGYVVTARLVDASGLVTTTNRTITIDLSKAEPSTHGV